MTDSFMKRFRLFIVLVSVFALAAVSCSKDEGASVDGPIIKTVTSKFQNKAVYGCPLTITGENFSAKSGGNVVFFGEEKVTELVASSSTEITVVVPYLSELETKLKVVADGVSSNKRSLQFDPYKCDSALIFRNATVEKIREDIVWTSTVTTWLGEPRSLNVLSIKPSETNQIGIFYKSLYGTSTSSQAISLGAVAAINAAYYGGTSHDGFVRVDGDVKVQGGRSCSAFFADGAFVIDNNVPSILSVKGNAGSAALPYKNVVGSGPLLVNDGQIQDVNMTSDHNTTSHPRTAIGVTDDNRLLFVTVDGRFPDLAVGMSSAVLARYMKTLGAKAALNLDGGGSTTMWIKGKGVVNHTSQGGTSSWNSPVERSVGSIIYVK